MTCGHRCGLCKNYGHGEIECRNIIAKNMLIPYLSEKLTDELKCKFGCCDTCYYHKTEAHHCDYCNERSHSRNTCPQLLENITILCPICKKENKLSLSKDKIYGLEDTCKICMDNTIEILLPACKHACMCIKCANQLNRREYIMSDRYNKEYILSILKPTPCYIMIREIMDNITYIRRLNSDSELEEVKLHLDIIENYNNFISGYEEINIDYDLIKNS
jgi:hypothetical protein